MGVECGLSEGKLGIRGLIKVTSECFILSQPPRQVTHLEDSLSEGLRLLGLIVTSVSVSI